MVTLAKITDESYKIRWDHCGDPIPESPSLVTARNDKAAFQVLLQSDHQYSVAVRPVEWFSRKAGLRGTHERIRVAVTAPFDVQLNIEGMMTDHDDVMKTDVLLTQDVAECAANLPTGVWAEVNVPADAKPGNYTVTVKVFSSRYGQDEALVLSQDLPLTVADYLLPDAKDWQIYINLWQHLSSVARHHDVPLWSDEHFAVLENYAKAIAALGQKSVTLCAGEIPWGGQTCAGDREHPGNLFEYSIIGITKKADGTFCYDYSKMQKYIDICTAAGITGDVEIFGLVNVWQKVISTPLCENYPENIVLRYLDESDGAMKYLRDREQILDYIKSLEQYFIRTGQIERVRIGADEPADIDRYRASLDLLKQTAPSFKCSTAINHAEFIEEFQDRIDTAAPYLGCVSKEYKRLADHKAQFPHKKLLWYVCGHYNIPNNCIVNPAMDNRCIGLLTDFLGMDGFLRWNFCLYPDDPRRDIRYSVLGTGDLNFVYPGKNGSVLLSLRYKHLQRGFADYELIHTLRKTDPEAADALLSKIFDFTRDTLPEFFERAKFFEVDPERRNPVISRNWKDYNDLKAEVLKRLCK